MRFSFLLIVSILIISPLAFSVGAAAPALNPGAIEPQNPVIDKGQSVTLKAHPSGGTPPYTYQWFEKALGGDSFFPVGTNSSSYTFTTASSKMTGNWTFKVQIDDSIGPAENSTIDTVTVKSALVAGAPTPPAPTIDSGQSITLTSKASGGTGSYTYQWYSGLSVNCSFDTTRLGTASNQTVGPTSSSHYCYTVTDTSTNAPMVFSPTDFVTINSVVTITSTTTYTATWVAVSTTTSAVAGLGGLQDLLYMLLALAIAILVLVALAMIMLLRRKPTKSDGEEFEVMGES